MSERTNIPISKENKIFHTNHLNFSDEKIPLQYAFELHTLDLSEAEEKKQQILTALQIKNKIEEWKKRLQSQSHLIQYTHEMLIDKIDNELLKGDSKSDIKNDNYLQDILDHPNSRRNSS